MPRRKGTNDRKNSVSSESADDNKSPKNSAIMSPDDIEDSNVRITEASPETLSGKTTNNKRTRKASGETGSKRKRRQLTSVENDGAQSVATNQPFDALAIIRNHENSAKTTKHLDPADSSVQRVVDSKETCSGSKNCGNLSKSVKGARKLTEITAQSPSGGVGRRVRKKRLEKRSQDPKLKNSERLKAIALSFDIDDRLKSSPEPAKGTKRKSLNSKPSVSSTKKRKTSTSSFPDKTASSSSGVTEGESAQSVQATMLPAARRKTKRLSDAPIASNNETTEPSKPTVHPKTSRRRKSEPCASKKTALQSRSQGNSSSRVRSRLLSRTPGVEQIENDASLDDDDCTLPELHTSTVSVDDVMDYRSFEADIADVSETADDLHISISKHIFHTPSPKTRLFCDKCDFFVDSIKIMAFHQKTHSRNHKNLSTKVNGNTLSEDKEKTKSGKMTGRKRKNVRSRTVDFPLQFPQPKVPKFSRRKSSFDPNVDEDATETASNPVGSIPRLVKRPIDNGCLTPSDSDDEDLPDICFNSSQDSTITKGDLVWVKYDRAPFWPAVVMHVYYKRSRLSRVSIVFIGNMGVRDKDPPGTRPWYKKLVLAYKSSVVIPFGSRNDELKHQGCSSEFCKALGDAIHTCEYYVHEKTFGNVTDHEEFFAEDIGTAEERFRQKLAAQGAFDEETLRKVIPQVSHTPNSDEEEMDEEEEVLQEQTEQLEDTPQKELTVADRKRKEWRIEQSKKLVDKMTSAECYAHVDKIYTGECQSERHRTFCSANTTKKRRELAVSHGYGPIMDDHWELMIAKVTEHTNKKYGKGKLSFSYLLDVWVPEAIVYAIQRVRKISNGKAEQVFKNGIRSTKSEREESGKALLRNHKNISQEDQDRYNAKTQRFLEENGYLLK